MHGFSLGDPISLEGHQPDRRGVALAAGVFAAAALGQLPRMLTLGPISALPVIVGIVMGLAAITVSATPFLDVRHRRVLWSGASVMVLHVLAASRSLSAEGLLESLYLTAPVMAVIAGLCVTTQRDIRPVIGRFGVSALLVSSLVTIGVSFTYRGILASPIGPRSSAWAAAGLVFAVLSSSRCLGAPARLSVFLGLAAIVLSGSRGPALAVGLLLVWRAMQTPRLSHRYARISLLVFATVLAIAAVPGLLEPVADRFAGGDNVRLGGVQVNTSGRTNIWGLLWSSFSLRPWVGHGAGAATHLVSAGLDSHVAQAHNDVLRIAHDTGVVGLAVWVALVTFLLKAVRGKSAGVPFVLVLLPGVFFDNVLVYPFFSVTIFFALAAAVGPTRALGPTDDALLNSRDTRKVLPAVPVLRGYETATPRASRLVLDGPCR